MKDANDLSGSTRGRYANRDTVAALRAELRFLAARVSALERQEPQPDRPAVAGRADLERVKSVVAAHYGLHPAIFSERCRRRSVVWPRQVGMWLARETTSAALEQVARAFGCASHSTVVKSHAATREAVEADASLSAAAGTPTLDALGIVGGGIHTPEEYADLDSIVPRLYLLSRLLIDTGSGPAPVRPSPVR